MTGASGARPALSSFAHRPDPVASSALARMPLRRPTLPHGFIVTRSPIKLFADYAEAAAMRDRIAAKARRPKKFVVMKQLTADGAVVCFVSSYKYAQAPTLALALEFFEKSQPAFDRPRTMPANPSARRKGRAPRRPEDRRIRCIINVSGAPGWEAIAAGKAFFAAEIGAQQAMSSEQMKALLL